ncbi:restriction endonuclease subunit S [Geomesophilobacter sediminis]|uniref:Restriction endonuclease subunit S n=1 Tax=Geomesophilobacter sediminis TaxID=2798584 RepID=A0A8J7ISP6_9BACT|nr:restriction endonuclease subunit S [Geomesophilobacter sediminis]MBJ6726364.1 restriction endonuclease subunit S [Geomesophilobacter sediminis]
MSTRSLKPGWKMVKFGDIAQNVAVRVDPADAKTDVYVGLEHLDPSTLHLRQWGHPSDVTGQKLAFKRGDVIFGRRRAYQRKLAVAEFDGICSAHAMVVRAKPKMVLPDFLPFFLQSDMFMDRAIEISVGSLSPTINWKTLKVQEFPLPPIDEQKRIAEILWAADEALEQFSNASEKLQQTRETYLRGLSSNGAAKKWKVTKLSKCFEIVSGQVDPKEEPYRSMPLVAPNHIEQNTGRLICIETAREQNAISGKYLFQSGDVVYSKIRPNLRKAFIAEFDGLCSADMYALRPLPDRIMTRFLLSILLGEHFTSFALTRCVRTGIPKLNRQELSEYELPLPTIEDQKQISSHLEAIDAEEQNLIRHRDEVLELKRQISREYLETAHV